MWRLLIALLNLILIVATVALGWTTLFGEPKVPSRERMPKKFDPTDYAIKQEKIKTRTIVDYRNIWTVLRPPPPPPKPKETKPVEKAKPVEPPLPPIERIAAQFELVNVSINSDEPDRSSCLVRKKPSKDHLLIRVGDEIAKSGLTLISLLPGEDETSVKAILKDSKGEEKEIELKQEPVKLEPSAGGGGPSPAAGRGSRFNRGNRGGRGGRGGFRGRGRR